MIDWPSLLIGFVATLLVGLVFIYRDLRRNHNLKTVWRVGEPDE